MKAKQYGTLCCEKVSKCIFDISLKQQTKFVSVDDTRCEKVSKCIFDISLKQQSLRLVGTPIVVKRFQNVSLT